MRQLCVLSLLSLTLTGFSRKAPDTQVQHVFIVVEENHNFQAVLGNASMPYLNGLATSDAYATNYYADTHPSIGNYFMLTTGQTITNDDSYSSTVTADNIVRQLIASGKTWKEYSEGLPSVGYTGGDSGDYTQHHNPLSFFSDVRNSSAQKNNLVPLTQLATDISKHALPSYGFIVPSNDNNSHDCPDTLPHCKDNQELAAADSWLLANIDPLIHSADFNVPGGGLLIIVFDESTNDNTHGGGQVLWVVVGPSVKFGHVSTTLYQHESTLRFVCEALGLTSFPGAASSAPDMEEFITGD
jgi:hypothetical protein